jgi:predicted HNH restriction endonuclease
MPSETILVGSSATTRNWLHRLRDELPQLEYSETKNWAMFKMGHRGGAVAGLNPSHGHVRLFLALAPAESADLQPTPSSGSRAAQFPSVFWIANEQDLPKARELILRSNAAVRFARAEKGKSRPEYLSPQELLPKVEYLEGSARQVLVNAYERNQRAREACLRHHGRICVACGFSFAARYGKAGAGYIQVHHIVPIAGIGKEYRLNPLNDLVPVCPNCHAVIHRREPPFSIEEVRRMLRN